MGEVVLSSEELEARAESETEKMEEEVEELKNVKESCIEKKNKKKIKNKKMEERKGETSSATVRWERFLPRMMLRVLLIEADDSTRQIIAALLRKCCYRGQCICLSYRFSAFVRVLVYLVA